MFKLNGFIKKTISAKIDGHINHLICYYDRKDFCQGHLGGVFDQRLMAELRQVQIPTDLILQQNFRKPAALECATISTNSMIGSNHPQPTLYMPIPALPKNNFQASQMALVGTQALPAASRRLSKRRHNSFPGEDNTIEVDFYGRQLYPFSQNGNSVIPHQLGSSLAYDVQEYSQLFNPSNSLINQNLKSTLGKMNGESFDEVFNLAPSQLKHLSSGSDLLASPKSFSTLSINANQQNFVQSSRPRAYTIAPSFMPATNIQTLASKQYGPLSDFSELTQNVDTDAIWNNPKESISDDFAGILSATDFNLITHHSDSIPRSHEKMVVVPEEPNISGMHLAGAKSDPMMPTMRTSSTTPFEP